MTLHPSHFLEELRRHPAGVVLITGNNRMPRPGAVPYRCDELADALEALALLAATAPAVNPCDACGGTGVVECWSPGGPCPVPPLDPSCQTCGPCSSCRPCATRCAGNVAGGPGCGCPPAF